MNTGEHGKVKNQTRGIYVLLSVGLKLILRQQVLDGLRIRINGFNERAD